MLLVRSYSPSTFAAALHLIGVRVCLSTQQGVYLLFWVVYTAARLADKDEKEEAKELDETLQRESEQLKQEGLHDIVDAVLEDDSYMKKLSDEVRLSVCGNHSVEPGWCVSLFLSDWLFLFFGKLLGTPPNCSHGTTAQPPRWLA